MAEGYRQGVGDVVWSGDFGQAEFRFNDQLHLFFVSPAAAGQQFLICVGL